MMDTRTDRNVTSISCFILTHDKHFLIDSFCALTSFATPEFSVILAKSDKNIKLLLHYYAALLPRRGPHIASHSFCLSVCLSVRPSRARMYFVYICTVLRANIRNRKTSDFDYRPASGLYFSARAEGRIAYGHLGRTSLLYIIYYIYIRAVAQAQTVWMSYQAIVEIIALFRLRLQRWRVVALLVRIIF